MGLKGSDIGEPYGSMTFVLEKDIGAVIGCYRFGDGSYGGSDPLANCCYV